MTQNLLKSSSSQCPSSSLSDIPSSNWSTREGTQADISIVSPVPLVVDDTVTYPEDAFNVFDCYIDLPTM